ncbi:MAG TPA: glycosyltransferase family 4 protein, partial [Tepidisphaeraceae bacterium]
ETAPLRTDEISYFLSVNQKRIMSNPRGAIVDLGKALLDTDSPEVWRDVLATLAFLAAAGRVSAQRIISNWTLSAPLPSSDQAGISQPSAVESCSHVAIISSEPADSQRQVLRRLDAELGGVKIHNIFTHSISSPAMPWQMRIEPRLNPVFFPDHHLPASRPISLRSIALYRDLKKYLQVRRVQMIILFGFDDLTRLLLIRWARRASIPLLLAGDANIFVDARTRAWNRLVKGMVVRWSLRRVFGLMPMGTCGRAFFRSYLDHRLPEFLFPCEPDYTAFAQPAPAVIEQFRAHHGLAADRKRFLYCGPLTQEKRVDLLLDAFIRTAGLCPDWDLVIAGDGPLAKQLQLMPPAALDDRIKWLGSISAENRPTLYHVCDVLVHPADCEPWGIVINEAIASNLPVITTSVVGAGVELIRHRRNGIIVTPRSVDSLANALCDMTRPDDYGEMRRWSVASLESWRKAADPVNAMRDAMRYFGLHSFPSATPTPTAEALQGELV